jgi:hypothetical protein
MKLQPEVGIHLNSKLLPKVGMMNVFNFMFPVALKHTYHSFHFALPERSPYISHALPSFPDPQLGPNCLR